MEATYISSDSFSVIEDKTDEFVPNRRVKIDCGTDGVFYSTIISSTYSNPNTIVNIKDSVVTSNIEDVLYGVVSSDDEGSLPDHFHTSSPGDGGEISYISEGELNTVSGSLQSNIDSSTANSDNWDTAYSWGDHSTSGYLKDITDESIGSLIDVSASGVEDGNILKYNNSTGVWEAVADSGSTGSTFLYLDDTPDYYDSGKYLVSTSSGIEWAVVSGSVDVLSFLDLTDTPPSFDEGKYLMSTGSGIEFAAVENSITESEIIDLTILYGGF